MHNDCNVQSREKIEVHFHVQTLQMRVVMRSLISLVHCAPVEVVDEGLIDAPAEAFSACECPMEMARGARVGSKSASSGTKQRSKQADHSRGP